MSIDINPTITVIFHLLNFLIGLDFVWCGYWYMKNHDMRRLPKLLGYLMLKIFETGNRNNVSNNRLFNNMFSMKAAGTYSLIGGIALLARSSFSLLYMLIQLP